MEGTKKPVSRDPEVRSGELGFAGTRVEVKTLVDYIKAGHTLGDFLEGFPTVSRDQAEAYLEGHVLLNVRASRAALDEPSHARSTNS